MALIACSECGKEISEKAPTCPGCGAPAKPAAMAPARPEEKTKRKTSPVAWAALVLLIGAGVWYTQTREYKEQTLPPIPVAIHHRAALLGSGQVLQVTNTSDAPLAAAVTLSNPSTQLSKSFQLTLKAKETKEIGHMEGWSLSPGDQIQVFNASFQSWNGSL
ncbi:MAG: zinc ribbon domain-containing protein [Pseudomonadota bacterium]